MQFHDTIIVLFSTSSLFGESLDKENEITNMFISPEPEGCFR